MRKWIVDPDGFLGSVQSFGKEFQDVVSKDPPWIIPRDRDVRHEIDLVLKTEFCVTRQWYLPKEHCDVIDDFFRAEFDAGMVRESKSPHSTPTFVSGCRTASGVSLTLILG
ncbi:hypothetical protein Plhal703r1_c58g0163881 [Plasmopara halstedii]